MNHLSETKISKDFMKLKNQKLILRIIHEKEKCSKSYLAKTTGLTLPAVTDILSELEHYRLVENIGESKTKRGRFPTLYQLNENAFKIIGITIRSETIRGAVINLKGKIVHFLTRPLPSITDPEIVFREVFQLVDQLMGDMNFESSDINGIGLGMHGIVDVVNGVSVYPPHLDWDHEQVGKIIEDRFQIPVLLDNDCNALTLAEKWFGAGKNAPSFVTVNVDYGIGAGIIYNGGLFHGHHFGGGQIGHTIVDDDGPLCRCGNFGCLESLASEPSILKEMKRKIKKGFPSNISSLVENPDNMSIEHVYQAALSGDELSYNTLVSAARYIGIGISTLINLFNPAKIVITGGFIRGKDIVMAPLCETAKKHALKTNIQDLEIVDSQLGPKADVIGAGTLWIDELFSGNLPIRSLEKQLLEG